jgi:hypothetical protein
MYLPDPAQGDSSANTLALLESATQSPAQMCEDNPEVQAAFDQSLRELAEDIIRFHPDLAHILVNMGTDPSPFVHGQN